MPTAADEPTPDRPDDDRRKPGDESAPHLTGDILDPGQGPRPRGRQGSRTSSTAASGRRPRVVIALIALVAVVVGWGVFSSLWADKLWFDALGFSRVFTTLLITRVALGVVGALVLGGALFTSAEIAWRLRPKGGARTDSELLRATRDALGPRVHWLILIPALLVGAWGATYAQSLAEKFLAATHATPFGFRDPTFHLDVSFFVFELPWLRVLNSFISTALVVALFAGVIMHYVTGGLRFGQGPTRSASRRARLARPAATQLLLLAGAWLVAYGLDALLDRYSLAVTTGTLLTGISYTDDHARITAKLIVALIAFTCAMLCVITIFYRRWVVPIAAVILLLVSGLVVGLIYPAGLQALVVKPSEPNREAQYMTRHIEATRRAYGIENVEVTEYSAKTTASAGQLRADAEALPGIRLMDPARVDQTFDQLQQVRGYYTFAPILDVDRYTIDGTPTDVVVAARELDVKGLPDANWNNLHTVYTHGFGLVAAYGNRGQASGDPDWIARDIPPTGLLKQTSARVYYGENAAHYVVVGARPGAAPIELDTPGGGAQVGEQNNTYQGPGVRLGSYLNRLVYATHFGDLNLLLSDRVHGDSKLLYNRQPAVRVQQVAPWLTADADPYPTLVDGRLVWVVDCYTTSNSFPNSHRLDLWQVAADSQRPAKTDPNTRGADLNYIRNAVKATVDAATGEVTLYAWDESDPILTTWRSVYPGVVKDRNAVPADLLQHLRYPEDLFKVQREVLGRYHMTSAEAWYKQSELWQVPEDPISTQDASKKGAKEPPYYLSIKWPGDAKPVFSLSSVMVPKGRANLAAYVAVNADAASPDYGKFRVLRMSDTQQIDGPGQAFNAMISDKTVAERLRPFLNQGSSAASFGNLLTLPLGGGLLFVTPVYTQREGASGSSYPALRFVIVRFGEHVAIAENLKTALDEVFAGDAGIDASKPPQPQQKGDEAAKAALAEASKAFDDADKALKTGDLATYQRKVNEAQAAMKKAEDALR